MALYNSAWLVVEEDPRIDNNRTAAFELRNVEESQSTQEPNYIMGGRGQFINQIQTFFGDEESFGVETTNIRKRAGYWLDGGAGMWGVTVNFHVSASSVPLVWGDERSGTGQSNVTKYDASGSEVRNITRRQVLDYWLAQTRSDSFANTRIHIGEYTDGSYPDYRGGEKVSVGQGVYDAPIPVAVESTSLSTSEDQGYFEGSITFQRVRTFPVTEDQLSDWAGGVAGLQTPLAPMPDE